MLSIYDATPGFYWSRYKDHGWVLIGIEDGFDLLTSEGGRNVYLLDDIYWKNEDNIILSSDWGKYIDLRLVKEPEFMTDDEKIFKLKSALYNSLPTYEDWMDGYEDNVKSASCRQLTFGEIRNAYMLLDKLSEKE